MRRMNGVSALAKAAAIFSAAGFLLFCGNATGQGVPKTTPVPNSKISLAQATQAPQRPRPVAPQGVVEGSVYWYDGAIKHVLPNSCNGLSVTVSSGGLPLATTTGDLTYMGDFANNVVCRYGVKGLPVGRSLQVQANVTTPSAFSPVTISSGGSQGVMITAGFPGCVAGGALNPSPSDLTSGWNSCADIAYNVNFVLLRTNEAGMPARSPVRLAPGVAVQNPGNGSGTLMTRGGQQSMLAAPPSQLLADGSKSSSIAAQRSAVSNGTITAARPANTSQVGTSQTMSAPGNAPVTPIVSTGAVGRVNRLNVAFLPRTTAMVQTPLVHMDPKVYVAQACAKNPSYRILFLSGMPDGKTLTVGPQYTIWGCSLGNPPRTKSRVRPIASPSLVPNVNAYYYWVAIFISIDSQFNGLINAKILSWTDNAIVFEFTPSESVNDSGVPLSGPTVSTELWSTHDGDMMIYGHDGKTLYFKP